MTAVSIVDAYSRRARGLVERVLHPAACVDRRLAEQLSTGPSRECRFGARSQHSSAAVLSVASRESRYLAGH
jgi:hypothetical protein